MQKIKKELDEKAAAAAEKKAMFGQDVDLERFKSESEPIPEIEDISELKESDRVRMEGAGIEDVAEARSGTFLQMNHSVIHTRSKQEGIEIMGTGKALDEYDWLWDYYWNQVAVDADKFTAKAQLKPTQGYFIRALPGVRSEQPVQACLYISRDSVSQNVHNIIIAEEDSELHIITGCTTAPHVVNGLHIGISEFYVKKNAKITFTMIHNWAEDVVVRPRSGIRIEEGGLYLSNYVCMADVKSLQMYPTARLVGQGAVARFNSVLVCPEGSEMDVGSRAILDAPNTRTEMVARTITTGGTIYSRGHLVGNDRSSRGHLECRGLMLTDSGRIVAIPELEATVDGVELSHEAAVGKISPDEIQYLMSRGLTEDEATATIVRGFLNVEIEGLPDSLRQQLDKAIELSQQKAL